MASTRSALKEVTGGRPAQISEEEWDLWVQLAAAYRIFDHLGWTLLIFNHITAKVPGPDKHFLINPFGLHYSEVTASNLIKVDMNTELDESAGVNRPGFVLHSAVLRARDDTNAVVHVHPDPCVAVSASREGCCCCRRPRCGSMADWPITNTRASPRTPTSAIASSPIWATSGRC